MPLIQTFIRNPVKVSVGVLLVALFGVLAMYNMPLQLIPEVQTPTLTIDTIWPGASPQEVERVIVQEQEKQLKSVEGIRKMTSDSSDSVGRITLEFPVGTDMQTAEIRVNSRLAQVPRYPEDVREPIITTANASDRPIAWFMLMQLTPTVEKIRAFAEQHPELKNELERVVNSRSDALKTFRLKKLAETHPKLKELIPPTIDVTTFRKFAEDNIESRFENIPGVANANVLGGREEEVQVIVDPEKLAARQLTLYDVRNALRTQNKDTSGGDFWELKRRYPVRTLGQYRDPKQVLDTIVARRNGSPVYVRDVAEVREGHKKPDGFVARFGSMCVAINAQRAIGSNVLDVVDRLKAATRELNESILNPRGLQLVHVYDETDYIVSARDLVTENLIEGAVLTFITLLLFLRNGRSTIIIFVHILVSTIGAFLLMALLGRSLNVPALGGLAFAVGMLVDNAIVMLENIFRRHQLGDSPMEASVRGASEVTGALLNATLANLAVFLPVLFIKEEAGQLFRDIALAICGAVGLSMLVAVTVVPTAALRLLRKPEAADAGGPAKARSYWGRVWDAVRWPFRAAERLFHWILVPVDYLAGKFVDFVVGFNGWVINRVTIRLGMVVVFVGGGLFLTWLMMPKVEYLPMGNRNLVIGLLIPPPGYSLDKLKEMGEQVEKKLLPYWDVDAGSPEEAEMKYPIVGDFFFVARARQVFLGIRALDADRVHELLPLVQEVTAGLPGTIGVAMQPSLFEQSITGGRTIEVEITGPDLRRLVEIGGEAFVTVMGMKGPNGEEILPPLIPKAQARPYPSFDLSSPEMHVVPKWEQAADMHLSADELGYTVDALVDGAYATDFFRGGDRIDLRILGDERFANRTQDLSALPVVTPTGELVPLSAVADIELSSGPEQIYRRTRQRAIKIEVTPPDTMPLETAMELIDAKIIKGFREAGKLEGGYRINLEGTADKLRSTWGSLRMNFILAVVITYLFMAATFESWLHPIVVMLSVPLGAVGGFVGLWALNRFVLGRMEAPSLDVLTMLGFFMLVGTVVNNPILIVEQAIANIRDEGMAIRDAVLDALRNRLRPIFMTTLGGLVGLLPLVIAPGAGSELYRGIGAVLLGGMVFSTFVTLFFVPALFSLALQMQRGVVRLLGWEKREALATTSPFPLPEFETEASPFVASPAGTNGNGSAHGDADEKEVAVGAKGP